MKKFVAVMMLSAMGTAVTMAGDRGHDWNFGKGDDHSFGDHHFSAPEIDPSSAISGMTLLLGGLTVLRGRMSKK